MKTVGALTLAILAVIILCPVSWAGNLDAKAAALEARAQAIQQQIDKAKMVNENVLNSQIDGVKKSIESLMRQRVNIDAHIARLEGQMQSLKQGADANMNRQMDRYRNALSSVQAELASLTAKPAQPAVQPAPAQTQAPVQTQVATKVQAPAQTLAPKTKPSKPLQAQKKTNQSVMAK